MLSSPRAICTPQRLRPSGRSNVNADPRSASIDFSSAIKLRATPRGYSEGWIIARLHRIIANMTSESEGRIAWASYLICTTAVTEPREELPSPTKPPITKVALPPRTPKTPKAITSALRLTTPGTPNGTPTRQSKRKRTGSPNKPIRVDAGLSSAPTPTGTSLALAERRAGAQEPSFAAEEAQAGANEAAEANARLGARAKVGEAREIDARTEAEAALKRMELELEDALRKGEMTLDPKDEARLAMERMQAGLLEELSREYDEESGLRIRANKRLKR